MLYGRKGGVVMDEETTYTFDMGQILWALGTGELTGELAVTAAGAWLANLMQDREDAFTVAREFAGLGLDAARAYELAQTPITAEDLPAMAKELIDHGLLPPPPGDHPKT